MFIENYMFMFIENFKLVIDMYMHCECYIKNVYRIESSQNKVDKIENEIH
jgi:hypothetical protein